MRVPNLAVRPFHWPCEIKAALPPSLISKVKFPKVHAWIDRFSKAVSAAKSSAPKPTTLKGAEAIKYVTQAKFSEPEGDVDASDPLGLKKGQDVESWPIDSGFKHHGRGRLVSLTSKEVVLASQSKVRGKELRIHRTCIRSHYCLYRLKFGAFTNSCVSRLVTQGLLNRKSLTDPRWSYRTRAVSG